MQLEIFVSECHRYTDMLMTNDKNCHCVSDTVIAGSEGRSREELGRRLCIWRYVCQNFTDSDMLITNDPQTLCKTATVYATLSLQVPKAQIRTLEKPVHLEIRVLELRRSRYVTPQQLNAVS